MDSARVTSSGFGPTAATSVPPRLGIASAIACAAGDSVMSASLEFLLGLLDYDEPAHVAQDDFDGVHGPALRLWQKLGFVSEHPGVNPVPSCPHCDEGVPCRIGERYICSHCC